MERTFEVLQARFRIIRGPTQYWDKEKLERIMRACIILHNMVVEEERDTYEENFDELLFYDNVDNNISQLKLGKETFALYKRYISKIISNFVIDKTIDNYRQT